MKHFIGLDVSLKETHVCVVDETGTAVAVCREATRPDLLASVIGRLAPSVERVVLETGGQSGWLQRSLRGLGVPTVIVDARQAKAALSCRLNNNWPTVTRPPARVSVETIAGVRPTAMEATFPMVGRSLLVKTDKGLIT